MTCLESTHTLLDTFLSIDSVTLRSLPVIVYTRMFYGVIILTKLAICANASQSGVGALLDLAALKAPFYIHKLIVLLQEAAGPVNFCVPKTFLSILVKLARWYNRQQRLSTASDKPDELLQPMAYMRTEEMPVEVNVSAAVNSSAALTDEDAMIQSGTSPARGGSSHGDHGTWHTQGQQLFSNASTATANVMHSTEPAILTTTHGTQLQQQDLNGADMLLGSIPQEFASFEAYTSSELDFAFLTFDSGDPSLFNTW
jgi:hypothetical protein